MKVIYKGVPSNLPAKLREKLDSKFSKLSKLLEQRGEKEAHVIVTNERHLHKAEVTLQFYDHQMVGMGADADLFNAMSGALMKLEKQALKHRTKWREKARRTNGKVNRETEQIPPAPSATEKSAANTRVYRVSAHERRKPITLEEAMIQMEGREGYLAYRDADADCVSVLIRRKDGNFDLIAG